MMSHRDKGFWHFWLSILGSLFFLFSAEGYPRRIVSLAPSCTEIVAGLGLAGSLVGVTQHCDWPSQVKGLPVVGSYVNLNLEAIVSLNPDLVIATEDGNPPAILARLQKLSIPVMVLHLRTYEEIQQSILRLGESLNRNQEASWNVDSMKEVAKCISTKIAKTSRPRILFAYESYPVVSAGKNTFTDQLIRMAGGISVTHDVGISYPTLTIENVIARNPEIIIESSMDPATERKKKIRWWQQWRMIDAVKNDRVYVLDTRNLDRPSQRIVYGLSALAKTLHPQLFHQEDCFHGIR